MKTKSQCWILLVGLTIVASMPSCRPQQNQNGPGNSNQGATQPEVKQLNELAKTLNLDMGQVINQGSERNMVGLKSDTVLFSQRNDSRTYFVEDKRYGEGKDRGIFAGSEAEVLERARAILQQLSIPADEIKDTKVLTEKTQTGKVDPATKKIIPGEVRDGKKTANITRQIKGIPVFSSHARIGLDRTKGIGFMELHWPEIPANVVNEAQRLQELVKGGWRAPEQRGAIVESTEAGIIHSPALGFVMDIYPAIRVIYAAENKEMGRKPMLYVDANGKAVPVPRQFERLPDTPAKARPAAKQ
jgi:hypothetical protein